MSGILDLVRWILESDDLYEKVLYLHPSKILKNTHRGMEELLVRLDVSPESDAGLQFGIMSHHLENYLQSDEYREMWLDMHDFAKAYDPITDQIKSFLVLHHQRLESLQESGVRPI